MPVEGAVLIVCAALQLVRLAAVDGDHDCRLRRDATGRGHPALHPMNKHEAHPMNKSLDEVLQTRPCMEALRHAGLCRLLAGAQRNILAHSRQKGQNNSWLPPPPLHP